MQVKNKIKGKIYIELMNYMLQKCDPISLTKYHDQHETETSKVINTILSTKKLLETDIIMKYSDDFLDKIYENFKNDKIIFNEAYQNKYEKNIYGLNNKDFQKLKYFNRKTVIQQSIMRYVYNNLTNSFIQKNKNLIILEKNNTIKNYLTSQEILHSTIYYVNLTNELKEEILNKKTLYDWCFPLSIEDICIFKNGYCWLYSVAHEELCDIYCENEEEYNYFKSIGIEFVDDKFIESDELYFEHYNDN